MQEWLPDLNAHVEAQFDTLNKKKEWYEGVVTQVNGDDTMTVLFRTNVSEQNLHPDRVRLLGGKPPKVLTLSQPDSQRALVGVSPCMLCADFQTLSRRATGLGRGLQGRRGR